MEVEWGGGGLVPCDLHKYIEFIEMNPEDRNDSRGY